MTGVGDNTGMHTKHSGTWFGVRVVNGGAVGIDRSEARIDRRMCRNIMHIQKK